MGAVTSGLGSFFGNAGKAAGAVLGPQFGASGGINGTGAAKPTIANLQPGTNANQIGGAYGANQNALAQQQALLQALQNQNYIGYQRNALNGLQNTAAAAGAVNGFQNQQNAYQNLQGLAGQQQGTLQQYQNLANGTGPNPAQAMLAQQTGQNVANQSAMMAGQRGASQNVGLIGRQAAQQGAATQQQAVGQGATMQAQQQLQGLQGLTAQQQAIGNTQQAMAGIGAQQVGAQQAAQQAYAGQANQLLGQQIGATTTNTQAQQSEQQMLQNALAQYNLQQAGQQANVNAANVNIATPSIAQQQKITGGAFQGLSSIGGIMGGSSGGGAAGAAPLAAAGAKGGMIDKSGFHYDEGGDVTGQSQMPMPNAGGGPQSSFGKFLQGFSGSYMPSKNDSSPMMAAKGGAISHDYRSGGHVKAKSQEEKAVKKGDDYKNDKIDAKLSEGEIVLPRHVTMSKDPVRSSAEFVRQVLAKKRARA